MTDPSTQLDTALALLAELRDHPGEHDQAHRAADGPAGVDRLTTVGTVLRELADQTYQHLTDQRSASPHGGEQPAGGEPR